MTSMRQQPNWQTVNQAKRHGDRLRADLYVIFAISNCDCGYVLHGLHMTWCNPIMPLIFRSSYGTHLLQNLVETIKKGNNMWRIKVRSGYNDN